MEMVSWPAAFRILGATVVLVVVVLVAAYLAAANMFTQGTLMSRWQQRIELARITTVLDRPQTLDGILFPARAEIVWQNPSHRRVAAARLPPASEVLGVHATNLRRVVEAGWIVSLAGATEIDGWACADGEVELTAAGRLVDCELSGTPTWRGWKMPRRTRVQPRPNIRQVWLALLFIGDLGKPLASPVLGTLDWIVAFNEDGSPFGCLFSSDEPYLVAGQELSGEVRWEYDPATEGMGRERPPVAVSGFVREPARAGTRRHVVLPWPGPTTSGTAGSR